MPTFAHETLFGSGPTGFRVQGLSLRFADHVAPGLDGTRVVAQGVEPRAITQRGSLLGDTASGVDIQLGTIETLMDGEPHELVDDQDRRFPGTLMTSVKAGPITRVGRRYRLDYVIEYLQLGE